MGAGGVNLPPLIEAAYLPEIYLTGGEIEVVDGMLRLCLEVERTAYVGMERPTVERVAAFRAVFHPAKFISMNARHFDKLAPYRTLRIVG